VLSQLGQRAVREGKKYVQLSYVPTEKNLPALKFITGVADQYRSAGSTSWTIPAERVVRIEYNPDEHAPNEDEAHEPARSPFLTRDAPWPWPIDNLAEALQRIAEELRDADRLATAIQEHRLRKEPIPDAVDLTTGSKLEMAVLNIWRKVLGNRRIGLNDNFFDAGGTSLRAVQVMAAIKKELKQNLSIVTLFECPTVRLLAAKLGTAPERTGVATTAAAALRGQRRRYTTQRKAPAQAA
jgi:acyl carrier protein